MSNIREISLRCSGCSAFGLRIFVCLTVENHELLYPQLWPYNSTVGHSCTYWPSIFTPGMHYSISYWSSAFPGSVISRVCATRVQYCTWTRRRCPYQSSETSVSNPFSVADMVPASRYTHIRRWPSSSAGDHLQRLWASGNCSKFARCCCRTTLWVQGLQNHADTWWIYTSLFSLISSHLLHQPQYNSNWWYLLPC